MSEEEDKEGEVSDELAGCGKAILGALMLVVVIGSILLALFMVWYYWAVSNAQFV